MPRQPRGTPVADRVWGWRMGGTSGGACTRKTRFPKSQFLFLYQASYRDSLLEANSAPTQFNLTFVYLRVRGDTANRPYLITKKEIATQFVREQRSHMTVRVSFGEQVMQLTDITKGEARCKY